MNRPANPKAPPAPRAPFEFVVVTILDKNTSMVAKDAEGALILTKSLSASEDVRSFRVFARDGIVTPAHVGQEQTEFPKWSA